jgi:hypothetical protein
MEDPIRLDDELDGEKGLSDLALVIYSQAVVTTEIEAQGNPLASDSSLLGIPPRVIDCGAPAAVAALSASFGM